MKTKEMCKFCNRYIDNNYNNIIVNVNEIKRCQKY